MHAYVYWTWWERRKEALRGEGGEEGPSAGEDEFGEPPVVVSRVCERGRRGAVVRRRLVPPRRRLPELPADAATVGGAFARLHGVLQWKRREWSVEREREKKNRSVLFIIITITIIVG